MAGQPEARAKRAALVAAQKASEQPQQLPEVPVVAGTVGVDLKIRSNGAACSYGLTAWSERGRDFITRNVLPLASATVGTDAVWFDSGENTCTVRAAMRDCGLSIVMGIGPGEDIMDVPATRDWVS